jgi:hypothetical protein
VHDLEPVAVRFDVDGLAVEQQEVKYDPRYYRITKHSYQAEKLLFDAMIVAIIFVVEGARIGKS